MSLPQATNTLILTGVDSCHFESHHPGSGLDEIKNLTKGCLKLISLKAFKRFLAVYDSVEDAMSAKDRLHGWVLTSTERIAETNADTDISQECASPKTTIFTLKVYFGAHTDPKWLSADPHERMTFLTLPPTTRNFLLSPPGSPAVGWVQTSEAEPSKGGFTFSQDLQDARIASEISLLDFTLDGGVEVGCDDDIQSNVKVDAQEKREQDGVSIRVVKFPSLDGGLELPVICISGDETIDVGLDSSVQSKIPQTSLPPTCPYGLR